MTKNSLDNIQVNFDAGNLLTINIALGLVMFGIALNIRINDFKILWSRPKAVWTGLFSQFFLLPMVTYFLVRLIEPLPSIALGMFMVAACPGGNVSNFITQLAKGNAALSICLTAMASFLAIFMTPLNFQFWSSLYGPTEILLKEVNISFLDITRVAIFFLGLPLVLGMAVNHNYPKVAKKFSGIFRLLSLAFLLILILIALNNNRDFFGDYFYTILFTVAAHNCVAYLTGFSIAKILGLMEKNVRSITIETGIQNSGLGLLLIFTFFDGLGGMALIAAFWGVWHLISGLLIGSYWSTIPLKKKIVT